MSHIYVSRSYAWRTRPYMWYDPFIYICMCESSLIHASQVSFIYIYMCESEWDLTRIYSLRLDSHRLNSRILDSFILNETWLAHTHSWYRCCSNTMTHAYLWLDSSLSVTWLIHMCNVTNYKRDLTRSYVETWLIHMRDSTHSCVWHDAGATQIPWLLHQCDLTYSAEWHDSFILLTWRVHMCDMTHLYMWHHAFTCVIWGGFG